MGTDSSKIDRKRKNDRPRGEGEYDYHVKEGNSSEARLPLAPSIHRLYFHCIFIAFLYILVLNVAGMLLQRKYSKKYHFGILQLWAFIARQKTIGEVKRQQQKWTTRSHNFIFQGIMTSVALLWNGNKICLPWNGVGACPLQKRQIKSDFMNRWFHGKLCIFF